ncbi:HK97-gp10 family putative phage morphogenesis protein [Bittarella massiliensis (ex Durand et al. 2017)]|uniref:HK97-gp10 family putative phage morphogenesis protein n=1 Tax=Bittarella massiliensis (ex Durand et al. 2017) TaxID=1720313 RepID=UPI001AA17902|nr:HK97-gp10 family putative phage morphogenesis protein [Bittarella massiliensis (ex Durand et al. 2017)]MBO1680171.1 hypothetical protein [Bittarella massiliensis (ex Durand et al. 2017)]
MIDFNLKSNLPEVQAELERRIANAATRCANEMERHAKLRCPVDTGRLRNSVTTAVETEDDTATVYVGSNVEYAPHVELGTSRSEAQPFLKPAVADHQDAYARIIRSELDG